jgi:glycosyltransferase involved in cell wall biosynthesis
VSEQEQMVVIDVAPVRAEPAGVGLYVARLTDELLRGDAIPLGLIGVRSDAGALGAVRDVPQRPFSARAYHAWMQLAAERDAHALRARLVHFTNAAAPLYGRLPYVLTVHDLSIGRMPSTHPVARWAIVPINLIALARAAAVIVPSEFTARELGRIGVDRARVVVIPHAPTLARPNGAGAPDDDVVARLGLQDDGYVLYFGTLEPRKNIARLVGAFERVAEPRPDLKLVLAGGPGWHYSALARRIDANRFAERIVVPGYVSDVDLATLIGHCAAVAYVSLYEGFGMPVLDARAIGAAVVTSRTSAMPEAAGGDALLVDPYDEADIARGIAVALADHRTAAQRIQAAAVTRDWADVAAEHVDVYRHVLARL